MPQLLVDLVRGSHGLSDFLPETFAETRAQALDSFLYGLLSQIDARGNFRQSQRILVSPNVVLEQVEETRASRRSVIITESMKRTIKLFFGPLPIEQCFRRRFRSGLDRVSLFRLELIQGNWHLATTAFESGCALVLMGKKVLKGPQEERAETTRFRIRSSQKLLFKKVGEKPLRHVLSVSRRPASPPRKGV